MGDECSDGARLAIVQTPRSCEVVSLQKTSDRKVPCADDIYLRLHRSLNLTAPLTFSAQDVGDRHGQSIGPEPAAIELTRSAPNGAAAIAEGLSASDASWTRASQIAVIVLAVIGCCGAPTFPNRCWSRCCWHGPSPPSLNQQSKHCATSACHAHSRRSALALLCFSSSAACSSCFRRRSPIGWGGRATSAPSSRRSWRASASRLHSFRNSRRDYRPSGRVEVPP